MTKQMKIKQTECSSKKCLDLELKKLRQSRIEIN